ncbi:MAG TPA: YkgJ family cysteine cluster protein [Bryobacteraceae bacterium]|nr:YkgJ family cysteine cluster protein [Bryobacteraceae bacterium]
MSRPIVTDLVQIKRLGEQKLEENKRLRQHMSRHTYVERKLKAVAQKVEAAVDCQQCANCCRTATARLVDRDIDKVAKAAGMKRDRFLRDCTEMTEDEGRILKRDANGCIFLNGNDCLVYEGRPASCEDFPHLVRGPGSLMHRMWVMPERATYCPITYNTLEEWKEEVGFQRVV